MTTRQSIIPDQNQTPLCPRRGIWGIQVLTATWQRHLKSPLFAYHEQRHLKSPLFAYHEQRHRSPHCHLAKAPKSPHCSHTTSNGTKVPTATWQRHQKSPLFAYLREQRHQKSPLFAHHASNGTSNQSSDLRLCLLLQCAPTINPHHNIWGTRHISPHTAHRHWDTRLMHHWVYFYTQTQYP